MSTKGLIADKRVERVDLNEAGKAAFLTLADPWRYNGEKGPFKLDNVDHGHKIVKGATGGTSARAPRAATAPAPKPVAPKGNPTEAMKRDPGSETPSTAAPVPPGFVRGEAKIYVYRIVQKSEALNHEVVGWLKTNRPWPKDWLASHSQEQLCQAFKGEREAYHFYEDGSFLWTKKMEEDARKAGDMGSPFRSENLEHGANGE